MMEPEKICHSNVPIILRKALTWNIITWTLDDWKYFFNNDEVSRTFKVRRGIKRCSKDPLWEKESEFISLSISDFFDKLSTTNKEEKEWLYFDYKHIGEWFQSIADKLDVSWKDFGYPDKTSKDSTIWIGTKGAHTPCHMDTYGCNLVGQVFGQKVWYLFPPSETKYLKPTRVPYEESTIYSSLNFACGCTDTDAIPQIQDIRVVTLNPGDVLFVPHNWWHYVENLSTAISINCWLPVPSDDISRLEESIVKYFVCLLCRSLSDEESSNILNPQELDLCKLKETYNVEELSLCLRECLSSEFMSEETQKSILNFDIPKTSANEFANLLKSKCVMPISSDSIKSEIGLRSCQDVRNSLIKAYCHPEVISLVRQKFLDMNK